VPRCGLPRLFPDSSCSCSARLSLSLATLWVRSCRGRLRGSTIATRTTDDAPAFLYKRQSSRVPRLYSGDASTKLRGPLARTGGGYRHPLALVCGGVPGCGLRGQGGSGSSSTRAGLWGADCIRKRAWSRREAPPAVGLFLFRRPAPKRARTLSCPSSHDQKTDGRVSPPEFFFSLSPARMASFRIRPAVAKAFATSSALWNPNCFRCRKRGALAARLSFVPRQNGRRPQKRPSKI